MPELNFDGDWDTHGLVPLANGLFDPATLTLSSYAPEHRATYRLKAHFDPGAPFAHGEMMLADMFAPYGKEEADKYIWLIRQFAYVAIFKAGNSMRLDLVALGLDRRVKDVTPSLADIAASLTKGGVA